MYGDVLESELELDPRVCMPTALGDGGERSSPSRGSYIERVSTRHSYS